MSTGGPLFNVLVIKKAGERYRLRLRRNALFHFARFFIDETEQNVFAAHTLTHVPNARMVFLHPDIDHSLKRSHAIPTLGAIKAFKPVQFLILSTSNLTMSIERADDKFPH